MKKMLYVAVTAILIAVSVMIAGCGAANVTDVKVVSGTEDGRNELRYGSDLSTLKMIVHYDDETQSEPQSLDMSAVSGYDASKLGKQTLTLSYDGNDYTFEVDVVDYVSGIEVTDNKNGEYNTGDELDITVRTVMASGAAGADVTAYTVSGYDKDVAGAQEVVVTYDEIPALTQTVSINVINPPVLYSDISVLLASKTNAFFANHYNQYTQVPDLNISLEDYYIEVGENIGAISSLKIGNVEFNEASIVLISIGNNSFIKKPPYVVLSGKLYISLPVLNLHAFDSGILPLEADNLSGSIKVFDAVGSSISLAGVSNYLSKSGSVNEISTKYEDDKLIVMQTRNHGSNAVALTFNSHDEPLPLNTFVFIRRIMPDGEIRYGIDKTTSSYSYFYYNSYSGSYLTSATLNSRSISVTLGFAGIGSTSFELRITEEAGA